MDGDRAKDSDERGIAFLPTSGSRAGGMMKEKTARITDAMTDLQLGIDGLRNPKSWAVKQHAVGADLDEVERRLRHRKSGVVTVVSDSSCVSADEHRRIGDYAADRFEELAAWQDQARC